MILSASAHRVPEHTPAHINVRIHHTAIANVNYYAQHPDQIDQRLEELDREWDIERTLETNAATLTLVGTVLAALIGRKWLLLPAIVSGFLLQHGLQGWCPPVSIFRRMGMRTPREIEAERYALKALRGDFQDLPNGVEAADPALQATGRYSQ